jgi:uncharacterized spore protein YtfJ
MSEETTGIIKSMWDELRKTIKVETAIGNPIEIEDKTLIPIFRVGFGAGGGGGKGKEKELVWNANELYDAGKELAGAITKNTSVKRLRAR